jgi:uncharacterized protein YeaO (DUF488 family)
MIVHPARDIRYALPAHPEIVGKTPMTSLTLKRVYAPASVGDGRRILIDRLWPRGITKEKARIDLWLRDIAPSDALRKRFHAKPALWEDFRAAYFTELKGAKAQSAANILLDALRSGPVTLVYAARDENHNNAVALREWLQRRKGGWN